MKPSIIRLRALEKQLYAYLYAMTVVDFDAESVAPEGSADGRAEATEVLSRASFDLLVNDGTAALLKEAAADAETEQERAEVRNLQRQYDEIARIPADEYAAFTKLCSQSVPAWTCSRRIWKRSSPPAVPRPGILRRTATPMKSCWTATRRA